MMVRPWEERRNGLRPHREQYFWQRGTECKGRMELPGTGCWCGSRLPAAVWVSRFEGYPGTSQTEQHNSRAGMMGQEHCASVVGGQRAC